LEAFEKGKATPENRAVLSFDTASAGHSLPAIGGKRPERWKPQRNRKMLIRMESRPHI
jgi:hypothetical protein